MEEEEKSCRLCGTERDVMEECNYSGTDKRIEDLRLYVKKIDPGRIFLKRSLYLNRIIIYMLN